MRTPVTTKKRAKKQGAIRPAAALLTAVALVVGTAGPLIGHGDNNEEPHHLPSLEEGASNDDRAAADIILESHIPAPSLVKGKPQDRLVEISDWGLLDNPVRYWPQIYGFGPYPQDGNFGWREALVFLSALDHQDQPGDNNRVVEAVTDVVGEDYDSYRGVSEVDTYLGVFKGKSDLWVDHFRNWSDHFCWANTSKTSGGVRDGLFRSLKASADGSHKYVKAFYENTELDTINSRHFTHDVRNRPQDKGKVEWLNTLRKLLPNGDKRSWRDLYNALAGNADANEIYGRTGGADNNWNLIKPGTEGHGAFINHNALSDFILTEAAADSEETEATGSVRLQASDNSTKRYAALVSIASIIKMVGDWRSEYDNGGWFEKAFNQQLKDRLPWQSYENYPHKEGTPLASLAPLAPHVFDEEHKVVGVVKGAVNTNGVSYSGYDNDDDNRVPVWSRQAQGRHGICPVGAARLLVADLWLREYTGQSAPADREKWIDDSTLTGEARLKWLMDASRGYIGNRQVLPADSPTGQAYVKKLPRGADLCPLTSPSNLRSGTDLWPQASIKKDRNGVDSDHAMWSIREKSPWSFYIYAYLMHCQKRTHGTDNNPVGFVAVWERKMASADCFHKHNIEGATVENGTLKIDRATCQDSLLLQESDDCGLRSNLAGAKTIQARWEAFRFCYYSGDYLAELGINWDYGDVGPPVDKWGLRGDISGGFFGAIGDIDEMIMSFAAASIMGFLRVQTNVGLFASDTAFALPLVHAGADGIGRIVDRTININNLTSEGGGGAGGGIIRILIMLLIGWIAWKIVVKQQFKEGFRELALSLILVVGMSVVTVFSTGWILKWVADSATNVMTLTAETLTFGRGGCVLYYGHLSPSDLQALGRDYFTDRDGNLQERLICPVDDEGRVITDGGALDAHWREITENKVGNKPALPITAGTTCLYGGVYLSDEVSPLDRLDRPQNSGAKLDTEKQRRFRSVCTIKYTIKNTLLIEPSNRNNFDFHGVSNTYGEDAGDIGEDYQTVNDNTGFGAVERKNNWRCAQLFDSLALHNRASLFSTNDKDETGTDNLTAEEAFKAANSSLQCISGGSNAAVDKEISDIFEHRTNRLLMDRTLDAGMSSLAAFFSLIFLAMIGGFSLAGQLGLLVGITPLPLMSILVILPGRGRQIFFRWVSWLIKAVLIIVSAGVFLLVYFYVLRVSGWLAHATPGVTWLKQLTYTVVVSYGAWKAWKALRASWTKWSKETTEKFQHKITSIGSAQGLRQSETGWIQRNQDMSKKWEDIKGAGGTRLRKFTGETRAGQAVRAATGFDIQADKGKRFGAASITEGVLSRGKGARLAKLAVGGLQLKRGTLPNQAVPTVGGEKERSLREAEKQAHQTRQYEKRRAQETGRTLKAAKAKKNARRTPSEDSLLDQQNLARTQKASDGRLYQMAGITLGAAGQPEMNLDLNKNIVENPNAGEDTLIKVLDGAYALAHGEDITNDSRPLSETAGRIAGRSTDGSALRQKTADIMHAELTANKGGPSDTAKEIAVGLAARTDAGTEQQALLQHLQDRHREGKGKLGDNNDSAIAKALSKNASAGTAAAAAQLLTTEDLELLAGNPNVVPGSSAAELILNSGNEEAAGVIRERSADRTLAANITSELQNETVNLDAVNSHLAALQKDRTTLTRGEHGGEIIQKTTRRDLTAEPVRAALKSVAAQVEEMTAEGGSVGAAAQTAVLENDPIWQGNNPDEYIKEQKEQAAVYQAELADLEKQIQEAEAKRKDIREQAEKESPGVRGLAGRALTERLANDEEYKAAESAVKETNEALTEWQNNTGKKHAETKAALTAATQKHKDLKAARSNLEAWEKHEKDQKEEDENTDLAAKRKMTASFINLASRAGMPEVSRNIPSQLIEPRTFGPPSAGGAVLRMGGS